MLTANFVDNYYWLYLDFIYLTFICQLVANFWLLTSLYRPWEAGHHQLYISLWRRSLSVILSVVATEPWNDYMIRGHGMVMYLKRQFNNEDDVPLLFTINLCRVLIPHTVIASSSPYRSTNEMKISYINRITMTAHNIRQAGRLSDVSIESPPPSP